MIVFGLYTVVWGKSKDSATDHLSSEKAANQELPITNKSIDFDHDHIHIHDDNKLINGQMKTPEAKTSLTQGT